MTQPRRPSIWWSDVMGECYVQAANGTFRGIWVGTYGTPATSWELDVPTNTLPLDAVEMLPFGESA
jgi:hypothetical protein